jgi:Holliday junction DNA helicase RuvA
MGAWQQVEESPGVGKKLAQRITAELKDKAPALSIAGLGGGAGAGVAATSVTVPAEGNAAAEAISALTNLGYAASQAAGAVAAAAKELGPDADTARLIRRGLRELAR